MRKNNSYVKQLCYKLNRKEREELRAIWHELEERRNVDVRDVSKSNSELVKEVRFRDNPGAEPESISFFPADFIYDFDDTGDGLTEADIEKIGVEAVEALLDDLERGRTSLHE